MVVEDLISGPWVCGRVSGPVRVTFPLMRRGSAAAGGSLVNRHTNKTTSSISSQWHKVAELVASGDPATPENRHVAPLDKLYDTLQVICETSHLLLHCLPRMACHCRHLLRTLPQLPLPFLAARPVLGPCSASKRKPAQILVDA